MEEVLSKREEEEKKPESPPRDSSSSHHYILSFDVGVKNLAYCLLDGNQKIIDWNIMNISHPLYEGRCSKLVTELDKINIDIGEEETITVIIEKQMSKNRTMMIISGQILMYYTLKKKDYNIKKVIYYSPKHKLKCYEFEDGDEPLKKIRAKPNTYAYRKNLSKQHCERIIKRNQSKEMIEFYMNLGTKKDDASDAFLQAVAYYQKHLNKN